MLTSLWVRRTKSPGEEVRQRSMENTQGDQPRDTMFLVVIENFLFAMTIEDMPALPEDGVMRPFWTWNVADGRKEASLYGNKGKENDEKNRQEVDCIDSSDLVGRKAVTGSHLLANE